MPSSKKLRSRRQSRGRTWMLGCLIVATAGLMPAAAGAWPEDPRLDRPRLRGHERTRPVPMAPPPAIVSGYLPRNHNVPMYNEPTRLPSAGPPAW